ncbi:hypothetical protein H8356DRAFT_1002249 [Neocallimastix lanati (nom. inval.)]|uniref:Uncharacterized protein n=1 Tax=Neocallimastix californiae TaxID=1754190 RepID=A0A1Y2AI10_9FUNG|nr:hypothetical protein H8356DRAFT_1002249 [Neocallimastix sp. JGI-2020a]ORY21827.1 hypothetical protein LY90DRAFT_515877 [Neocallimastix californiae]|eukprot:ORY21827.1 hypothetical protein LY90DRAFT_515877 [Neocallimastix californiae]
MTLYFICFTYSNNNYFSDCYGFTEDELKNVLSNFNISNSKEKSDDIEDGIKEILKKKYGGYSCVSDIEKNEELKNLLKISILNFDVEFLNLLRGKIIEFSFDKLSPIE